MTPEEKLNLTVLSLNHINEIAYSGHPDGREARLEMIHRIASRALELAAVDPEAALPREASRGETNIVRTFDPEAGERIIP